MATAPTTARKGSASRPALATGGGPALMSRPLELTANEPWTLMISAAALEVRNGLIVPRPAMAPHTPGLLGNGRDFTGRGAQMHLMEQGYVVIPHDFSATAFGEDRAGSPLSTYIEGHEGVDRQGRQVVHHTDAWRRPRRLGHTIDWQSDDAGRDEFLHRALLELTPECKANGGKLLPVQIDMALANACRRARTLAVKATPNALQVLKQQLRHIPREHAPADILALMDQHLEAPTKRQK